MAIYTVRKLW